MIGGGYIGGSTFETKVTRSMQGLSDTIFRSVRPSVQSKSKYLYTGLVQCVLLFYAEWCIRLTAMLFFYHTL